MHCLPFGTEGNDSELCRNGLDVSAHNAVWAACCFDLFQQLCDILCNYLRLQIVIGGLRFYFLFLFFSRDLLYKPLECQIGIKC